MSVQQKKKPFENYFFKYVHQINPFMGSASKLSTSKQNMKKRSPPKMYNSVNEFYAQYEEDGFVINNKNRHWDYHVANIESRTTHTKEITSMYEGIYRKFHIYSEILDSSYFQISFDDFSNNKNDNHPT